MTIEQFLNKDEPTKQKYTGIAGMHLKVQAKVENKDELT
jgi:hypothetical protein